MTNDKAWFGMPRSSISSNRHQIRNTILRIWLIVCLLPLLSCSDPDCEEGQINSSTCFEFEPVEGNMLIEVTVNITYPAVPITVYDGDFEDGIIVLEDTLRNSEINYILPLGAYSVTALYASNGDTILAIDGDMISTKQREFCNGTCYELIEADLDVRLVTKTKK